MPHAHDALPSHLSGPIGAEEFAALMAPLGPWLPDVPDAPVAIAVSGGADSMALAVLARRWRRNVVAFVVDHGLRPESAREAVLTVERLAHLGLPARILTFGALAPGRVQERARDARFEALESACVAEGCLDLLVAHHADDQIETVWMRHARGSGPLGLGGMWPTALRGRIRLVRPLLDVPSRRLRSTLVAATMCWIEDPSNANRRFERVRWRQDLSMDQRRETWIMHRQARVQASAFGADLAERLARTAVWYPEGWVHLQPEGVCEPCISALIRLLAGARYPASRAAVRALVERGRGSLGGVVVKPAGRFGDGVVLVREERSVQVPVPAVPGAVWDRRWRLCGLDVKARSGYMIGPLGDGARGLDLRRMGVPRAAARTLPALWRGGTLAAYPAGLGVGDAKVAVFEWAGAVPITGDAGI